jgi:hypothetical protein
VGGPGYDATLLQRMLGEYGPVDAVRRLVLDPFLWIVASSAAESTRRQCGDVGSVARYKTLFVQEVRDQAERKPRLV